MEIPHPAHTTETTIRHIHNTHQAGGPVSFAPPENEVRYDHSSKNIYRSLDDVWH